MGNLLFTLIIYPITQIIEFAFSFSIRLIKNNGFSLLGVSLTVSLLTLPLYAVAERWQKAERDVQAKMKSQVDRIKKTFKGDEQYMILSTYYKQNHYHPIMSLRSAFGILIQIPFFMAAYSCLSHMTALQGRSLFFIQDLGKPDALFSIGNFQLNILPLLMTAINLISGAIYTKGLPVKEKLQVYLLALVFVILLYNSPSGLVIYWTMNNIFSLIKNIFYKLKNPLKTFYFVIAFFVIVAIIYTVVFKRYHTWAKILLVSLYTLILLLPLIVKFFNFITDKFLSCLLYDQKRRTTLFFVCSSGLAVLIGLVIPSTLIASSPIEFSGIYNYPNPTFFLKNTFVQSIGLCFIWPTLIYFLFKERVQTMLTTVLFFFLAVALVNYFFFKENYGNLSNVLIFTDIPDVASTTKRIILNLVVIAFMFAFCITLFKFNLSNAICVITAFSLVAFSLLSFVQIGKIRDGYKEYLRIASNNEDKNYISQAETISPIFHLSKTGKNVVLIFLDRAQNQFIEPMFEESPELEKQFSGFTLYKNTVSYNGHTLIGVPPIHGGYEYTPIEINKRSKESLVEKHNEALLLLPRIFTEQGENFSAASSDASWANYSWIPDTSIFKPYPNIEAFVTENTYLSLWYKDNEGIGSLTVTSDILKRNMLWYSLFRISPLFLRDAIYLKGKYWSTDKNNLDLNTFLANYAPMYYLKDLTDFNSKTENYFLSFTNNTTHSSMFLQAPDFVPVAKVTYKGTSEYANNDTYSSMAGVIHRLGEWLEYLKENGVYDNTRILIVSDHGCSAFEKGFETEWEKGFKQIGPGKYHPLFMFKDFNETGKLKISEEFMTNADCPFMLTEGIIENPTNPFTGKTISNDMKKQGALITTSRIFMPYHTRSKNIFTIKPTEWYRVSDNIFESKNWTQEIMEENK